MKKLCYYFLISCILSSCAASGPSTKKHSYETREGKQKLKRYNDLYNGTEKQFDYRLDKTKKVQKKAGYKPKKK